MMKHYVGIIAGLIVALILLNLTLFTVDQRENAIVFRFGEMVSIKKEPGLYARIPFLDNVRYFETRIVSFDIADPERFLTSEKKNVSVSYFVKWRIVDVQQYYLRVDGDEGRAENRLQQRINAGLRDEFSKRTVHEVVSGERDKIMQIQLRNAEKDAQEMGVQVVDVRLKRVDLSPEISGSVYSRMEQERKRVANESRSRGDAESERIRADADKQREVIIAEAYRQAQQNKGEGDAKAAQIYSQAYQQDPEFYAFYRSLEAYKQSFKSKNDVLILEPQSEFCKYFRGKGLGK